MLPRVSYSVLKVIAVSGLFLYTNDVGATNFTGTGAINIAEPIVLAKNSDLSFGKILRSNTNSCIVTIDTLSSRSISGTNCSLLGSTFNAANYSFVGAAGFLLNMNISPISPPGSTIALSNFTLRFAGIQEYAFGTPSNGIILSFLTSSGTFSIGARATVPNNVSGLKTGSYTLNVNYY